MPWKELIRYPNWKNVWQKVQSTRKKGVVKGGWDSEPSRGEEKLGKAPLMKPKMLVMVYDTRLLCAVLETKLDSEKHLFVFFRCAFVTTSMEKQRGAGVVARAQPKATFKSET